MRQLVGISRGAARSALKGTGLDLTRNCNKNNNRQDGQDGQDN